MAERTLTDATSKALEQALNLARDNGHSTAYPLHLAFVLFQDDDSIGARVCIRTEKGPDVNVILTNQSTKPLLLDIISTTTKIQKTPKAYTTKMPIMSHMSSEISAASSDDDHQLFFVTSYSNFDKLGMYFLSCCNHQCNGHTQEVFNRRRDMRINSSRFCNA